MVYKQCVESTVKTVIGRKGDNNKKQVFKEMAQKIENLVKEKIIQRPKELQTLACNFLVWLQKTSILKVVKNADEKSESCGEKMWRE